MTDYMVPPYIPTPIPSTWTVSGGGWAGLNKDICKYNAQGRYNLTGANSEWIDYSPSYYDRTCVWSLSHAISEVCFDYTTELNQAYNFAYSFDITTINPCKNVRMSDNLLRKDMAKMMVNFVIKVLNRQDIFVENPKCENYSDMNNETPESRFYIQTACKLGLMGLESNGTTPSVKFKPYGIVTRAEFGTVLSRLLRWTDNIAHGSAPYYQEHLSVLKETGIMTKVAHPEMKELRGWVFLMMNRIYEMGK